MIKVGEKLKEERKRKGLSLEMVAKATKIRITFLQAIEDGKYSKLPGSNYAHGFVKNYAEYLGLPVKEYLALFRREYDENTERKVLPEGLVGGSTDIPIKRFALRQAFWLGGIVLLALFAYLLFQYRAAIWSPQLTVNSPVENATIHAQSVSVSGTTDPDTAVTVNTLPAYVDSNGKFVKVLPVFAGNATISVKAVNSFGKVSTVERHITVAVQQ